MEEILQFAKVDEWTLDGFKLLHSSQFLPEILDGFKRKQLRLFTIYNDKGRMVTLIRPPRGIQHHKASTGAEGKVKDSGGKMLFKSIRRPKGLSFSSCLHEPQLDAL